MICANCTEDIPDGKFCPLCGKSPLLDGRYRLDEVVGHGAHGTTYRGTRLDDYAVIAIKELLVRKVESLKAIDLFQREVRVLRELDHRGVPDFIDEVHVDAGRSVALYLVQEFIAGRTIAAEFAERRGTEAEVFELAAELLDTLAYLHTLRPPVIHRDIKPGNVMRRSDTGELVLIDFGSVRDAVDTAEGGSTVAGTFGYMAPEQFMGRAIGATDIYGVGATIVALLSRMDPQELLGPDRTIEWQGKLGLSRPFSVILQTMLAEDPAQRADDAAELAAQIRAALRGEFEVPHPLARPGEPAPRPLLPAPPAPRELPDKFRKRYVGSSDFNLPFGIAFLGAGLVSGGIPIVVGVSTGTFWPALMSLLFLGIFGGIGGVTAYLGYQRLQNAKIAYQHGVATPGFIVDVGSSSYRVNNRSATVYKYEYMVDGTAVRGEYHSWEGLDLSAGDEVTILQVPGDAAKNVLFEPQQFSKQQRVREHLLQEHRAQLLQSQGEREVQLDFDTAEETEQAEVEQDAQAW